MKSLPALLCLLWIPTGRALAAPSPPSEKPKPVVSVQRATPTPIFDLLSYPARVTSTVNATILSETEGVVTTIEKPLGSSVKKGEPLLRLQHTDPVFQYAPVVVRAPVAGVVGSLEVTLGARVAKGQKLATVTDPDDLRLIIEVVAADLPLINAGLKGEFRRTGSEEAAPVKVSGVSPFVDPGTGTATAELKFEGDWAKRMQPGLVGRISFRVREHEGVQLPEEAIVYRGKDTFVRVVDENGKAKLRPVQLGPMRQGAVEILTGIEPGSRVVVRASQYVPDGATVQVEEGKAAHP